MTWDELDWPALDRLRDGFLRGGAASGHYWQNASDLASYDFTYGERIGWKWDHVLRELRLRGWSPRSRRIFDWGCGSGIAGRRVVEFFGAATFDELLLWDHSPVAADFAAAAASRAFPSLQVSPVTPGFLASDEPLGLLLISHVLNELSVDALASLRAMLERADAMLWVEPGTHEISRRLGQIRDALLPTHRVIAPCTHQLGCPMFRDGRERDWCHFFAPPPAGIHADSDWVKFGQRAGIDLRSLPYAFFATERTAASTDAPASIARAGETPVPAESVELSRVIGRAEHFKPYARVLSCDAAGLADLELPKRADPALFKQLERTKSPLLYHWHREGNKIVGGEPLAE
ncbi:small ribosomal subunit Rsm22 family protein [Opitutus terrae]|uniref:Ribosomal small subunit Rsm22 n=1 Tax=Opitutus terrae (strain DSM 11246 / JCM 15787 / PB90-1) TaxID=452637 RepID=B1ZW90_OPITP|nr:small ribosomal subunit Rsm22 family protein [Opitutus terrae]ACB76842.1 Ribosomal small subunit Rsm22 [Opitutus terrae PB90-1]